MKKARSTFGRVAIDELRAAYMAGMTFANRGEIVTYLESALSGFKRSKHAVAVGDWDRQARLELAEHNKLSITNPVYANGYKRNSTPTVKERRESRAPRRRDTQTRVQNDHIEAEADAAQKNATAAEKAIVPAYEAVEKILEVIETLS
jgi:hypothetical protein